MSVSNIRVGIISANWGAYAHLPAWRSIPGVEVVGICTSRRETAEAAANRLGVPKAFWDYREMAVDPDIDLIDCGTRPNIRHEMVLSALRAGKHVYNGIPFAASLAQARELHDAWCASGLVGCVDAFIPWIPAHRLLKEMVDDGFLGRPFGGSLRFHLSLFNQPRLSFPFNWFAQSGQGVSALRNLGSHALHFLVHLFGDVAEVMAHDSQVLAEWRFEDNSVVQPETNDLAHVTLRFANGMVMQVQLSWSVVGATGWSFEAFGSAGHLMTTAPEFPTTRDTRVFAAKLGEGALQPVDVPERLYLNDGLGIDREVEPQASHPMALMMSEMVAAIRHGGHCAPDFAQAWHVERVLEAARLSHEKGSWIALADVQ